MFYSCQKKEMYEVKNIDKNISLACEKSIIKYDEKINSAFLNKIKDTKFLTFSNTDDFFKTKLNPKIKYTIIQGITKELAG
jgi:hypothetical protein